MVTGFVYEEMVKKATEEVRKKKNPVTWKQITILQNLNKQNAATASCRFSG